MRIKIILTTIILLILPKVMLSQDSANKEKTIYKKNQIGIQFNPYINEQLFKPGGLRNMPTVSALRYGYRINKNVTTGMEFSCGFPININSGQNFQYFNYFSYNIGLYARYSILTEKRFRIFAEASPYFSHYYREWTSINDPSPYKINKFGYYVAPGVTLYSKNKKFSFDLYSRFSNLSLKYNKFNLSYKFNFNF